MKKIGLALLAALLILTACSGSPTSAPTAPLTRVSGTPAQPSTQSPQGAGRFGGGTTGTIAGINGNTMILNTYAGQVTFNLSANVSIEQILTAAPADLQVGQSISVTGTADTSGNMVADAISVRSQNQFGGFGLPGGINPEGRFGGSGNGTFIRGNTGNNTSPRGSGTFTPGNRAAGTLAGINGNILTITDLQGQSVTVSIATGTTIQMTLSGTISDLNPGKSVTVIGSPDANGSINAFSILLR